MKNQPIFLWMLLLSGTVLAGYRAKTSFSEASETTTAPEFPASQIMKSTPITDLALVVTARASKSKFLSQEPIELEIEVKNTSDKTVVLQFNSGQNFDFSATQEGRSEIMWRWSRNKRFIQALRLQQLEAGKSLQFAAKWESAAPGRYIIGGIIAANGGLKAESLSIVVQ
ncbi:Intracellular proteinase inhibitor [Abditibacterium utsteinense]|uniref:Intracellular proteinase inhibitor n=1 Tax=Abditibacterium utsteinense TaxID=1960156 RepID=A0A2S8SS29_9BACT|nr:BsuPI-related putative proteinase inhibitor [Abditibacterium utsteinense]PQV63611.1 Intracellular proteinase inhibitor [Abditibacterium utsteinense]